MTERIVLAYSGGLDTSVAIGWIADATGAEVVAVAVDVGQGGEDLEVIRQRALDCGAVEAYVADARDEFAEEYCMPALKANALYHDKYPLVSALSRPVIVKHIVKAAREFGATTMAHGCTGKGNDQVRFEVGIASLAPELKCIAPVRDLALTRDKAIDYAEKHAPADRDHQEEPLQHRPERVGPRRGDRLPRGHLERAHQGRLRLHRRPGVPAGARRGHHPLRASGIPVAIDGQKVTPLQAIQEMNRRAGAHGIGRIDIVEDRLVGIKSREIYEAPGAIALIEAHREMENVTLEREQARYKRVISEQWTELVYDGMWSSPAQEVARRVHRGHPAVRHRRHSHGAARRHRRPSPAAAPTSACTTSTSPRTTRAIPLTRAPLADSSRSTALPPSRPRRARRGPA